MELLILLACIFGIILAILALLMPFFVFRIRNEAIITNKQLKTITSLLKSLNTVKSNNVLKECPFCAEIIKPDAILCRFCGRDLPKIIKKRVIVKLVEVGEKKGTALRIASLLDIDETKATKLVESYPCVIIEDANREVAVKIKETLERFGSKVELQEIDISD